MHRGSVSWWARLCAALLLVGYAWSAAAQDVLPERRGGTAGRGLAGTVDTTPVELRVGPHRFRIPRNYFRLPPPSSGVGTGFYIRVLWPGMEPETAANRAIFGAPAATAEGARLLQIVLDLAHPAMPRPTAPWMLENAARGQRGQETRLEDFDPPSAETFGLYHSPARDVPGGDRGLSELFYGSLPDGRFAALSCKTTRFVPVGPRSCAIWFDWRPGLVLRTTFLQSRLPEWREIGAATLALVDGFRAEDAPK